MDIRREPSNPAAVADPISACVDNPSESPATGTPGRRGKTARTRKTTSTEQGDHDLVRHTRDKTGPPPPIEPVRPAARPTSQAQMPAEKRSAQIG